MKYLIGLLLISTLAFGAYIPKNFTKAKDMSVRLYHTHHLESFYTDTTLIPVVYIYAKKFPYKSALTLQLGMANSPYTGTKYASRGQKIEWEHVTPASWFTTADSAIHEAWYVGHVDCATSSGTTYKGRKCASKVSDLFNKMESDMYNLVPVIGALNAMRSDKPYGEIEGEERLYGESVDFEIESNQVEVMPSKRGNVARIMIYMNSKYGVQFPDHNTTMDMLKVWIELDPEDEWEQEKKAILKATYGMEF